VERRPTRCKPSWSRTYIVGLIRPGWTDPSRMERNALQICTEPDLQRWAGPEWTYLASKMLNANPRPPQRTGLAHLATAEDKTGLQTL
jgi:hypothetical protein